MSPSSELEQTNMIGETIRFNFDNLFNVLTSDKWRELKLGAPKKKTKYLLAELITNLTTTLSCQLFSLENEVRVTVDEVKLSLGDTLCYILSPGGSTNSETLDKFKEVFAEELTEMLNASLSRGPPRFHQTTAHKLEKMVSCLSRVLKESSWDLEGLYRTRVPSPHIFDLGQGSSTSNSAYSDYDSYSDYSVGASSSGSKVRSSDRGESESVQEILMKEASDILEPLVNEMSKSDLNGLLSEVSLEFQSAADEIYRIISKEESVKFSKSPKRFWKGVGQKIKKLLVKLLATASMVKMGTEVRSKFCKGTQVQSRESVKSLMDSVESVLLTETRNTVSPEMAPVLSDVLYRYITYDTMASPVEVKKVSVRKSHRKMYANIKKRVINSLPLMNWWFSKQAGDYTKSVTSSLMEIQPIIVSQVSEINIVKEGEESGKKIYLSLLIDQLVTRAYAKTKVNLLLGEPKEDSQNLLEKTWAEVKDIDFDMSPEMMDKLPKAMFKDLCKMLGCKETLLISIRQRDPVVEKRIATCMKSLLVKKPVRISRFCSFLNRFFKW